MLVAGHGWGAANAMVLQGISQAFPGLPMGKLYAEAFTCSAYRPKVSVHATAGVTETRDLAQSCERLTAALRSKSAMRQR